MALFVINDVVVSPTAQAESPKDGAKNAKKPKGKVRSDTMWYLNQGLGFENI